MSDKRFIQFVVLSLVLHVAFFFGSQFKWKEKKTYMNSDVLLMGDGKGKKINPPKPKEKKEKKEKKIVQNDPNAVHTKEIDDAVASEADEEAFGQGGKVALPYDTELNLWITANKKYPKLARRLGHEGVVSVSFNIQPDGKLTNIQVKQPCEYESLNKAAVETVLAANPFKPFPATWNRVKPLERVQSINYSLR